jgi:hypothetical protein
MYPRRGVKVLDNCCGQNKSQMVVKMEMLLSIVYEVDIDCLFLKSGHSHNRADSVVGDMNNSLRGNNWYHPADMVKQFNTVKNVNAVLLNNKDFYDWEGVLNKHFPKALPLGYTSNYFFRYSQGVLRIYELHTSAHAWQTIRFCSAFTTLQSKRAAIIKDLFGDLNAHNAIEETLRVATGELLLQNTPENVIAPARVASISNKYQHIPEPFLSYYPQVVAPQPAGAAGPASSATQQSATQQSATQQSATQQAAQEPPRMRQKPGPKPKAPEPVVSVRCITSFFQPIAKLRRTRESVEGGPNRCKGCGEEVGGVHACDRCGAAMHIFCGTPIGEEGYGQKVRCPACC